jgi:hypothetical protein
VSERFPHAYTSANRAAIEHLHNLTLMDENQRDELLRKLELAVYQ